MLLKDAQVQIKAGPDDGLAEGRFTAYASVFGNLDSYGDVVATGAFTKDLARWEETGNPIPLLFGHNMSDPDYNIGHVEQAEEDDHGLLITAQLDLENPKAAQVYRLLKGRRINQMSYAYDVIDADEVDHEKSGTKANELRELRLYEISVVTIGANEETEVLAVKHNAATLAAGLKVGRKLSTANETALREARDAIDSVLDSLDSDDQDEGPAEEPPGSGGDDQAKASGTPQAKPDASAEEPARAKASVSGEEPKANPSARVLAAHRHLTLQNRS